MLIIPKYPAMTRENARSISNTYLLTEPTLLRSIIQTHLSTPKHLKQLSKAQRKALHRFCDALLVNAAMMNKAHG